MRHNQVTEDTELNVGDEVYFENGWQTIIKFTTSEDTDFTHVAIIVLSYNTITREHLYNVTAIVSEDKSGPYLETAVTEIRRSWNPDYDQDAECECGHSYDRHFDGYENMSNVGCKYCGCWDFVLITRFKDLEIGQKSVFFDKTKEFEERTIGTKEFEKVAGNIYETEGIFGLIHPLKQVKRIDG